jgi:hypothetical protein
METPGLGLESALSRIPKALSQCLQISPKPVLLIFVLFDVANWEH